MSFEFNARRGLTLGCIRGFANLGFQRQGGQGRIGFILTVVNRVTVIEGVIRLEATLDRLTFWANVDSWDLRRENIRALLG